MEDPRDAEIANLQAKLDSQTKDFEARSKDYHDSLIRIDTAKNEAINRARRATDALAGLKHRTMADGEHCWCLLWPDEDPEPTIKADGHWEGCLAARKALKSQP